MANDEIPPPVRPLDLQPEIDTEALHRTCASVREHSRELCERSRKLPEQYTRLHRTFLGLRWTR